MESIRRKRIVLEGRLAGVQQRVSDFDTFSVQIDELLAESDCSTTLWQDFQQLLDVMRDFYDDEEVIAFGYRTQKRFDAVKAEIKQLMQVTQCYEVVSQLITSTEENPKHETTRLYDDQQPINLDSVSSTSASVGIHRTIEHAPSRRSEHLPSSDQPPSINQVELNSQCPRHEPGLSSSLDLLQQAQQFVATSKCVQDVHSLPVSLPMTAFGIHGKFSHPARNIHLQVSPTVHIAEADATSDYCLRDTQSNRSTHPTHLRSILPQPHHVNFQQRNTCMKPLRSPHGGRQVNQPLRKSTHRLSLHIELKEPGRSRWAALLQANSRHRWGNLLTSSQPDHSRWAASIIKLFSNLYGRQRKLLKMIATSSIIAVQQLAPSIRSLQGGRLGWISPWSRPPIPTTFPTSSTCLRLSSSVTRNRLNEKLIEDKRHQVIYITVNTDYGSLPVSSQKPAAPTALEIAYAIWWAVCYGQQQSTRVFCRRRQHSPCYQPLILLTPFSLYLPDIIPSKKHQKHT